MSRGPLEVLREVLAVLERSMPTPLELPGETNEHPIRVADRIHDYREAIAQVEALVPREPTDEMVEAGRTAVMALECSGPKWTVRQHYAAMGEEPKGIDDALLDMHCPMPKACRAELIYKAMVAAFTPGQDSEGGGHG